MGVEQILDKADSYVSRALSSSSSSGVQEQHYTMTVSSGGCFPMFALYTIVFMEDAFLHVTNLSTC